MRRRAFTEAVATAEKAEGLAEQSRQPELAARNRALLEHYPASPLAMPLDPCQVL